MFINHVNNHVILFVPPATSCCISLCTLLIERGERRASSRGWKKMWGAIGTQTGFILCWPAQQP